MKASEIFQSLPMGELLEGVDRTLTNEVLKAYIHDFIYMVHPVQSEAECNVRIVAFDGSTLVDLKYYLHNICYELKQKNKLKNI